MLHSNDVKLSVERRDGDVRLKLESDGKKSWEHMEVIVRLSESDRAWLRRELK